MAITKYFEDVAVGDEMTKLVKKPVNKVQIVKYAGASGDFNPLHTDEDVGKSVGLGGVIAHGMLIMGFVGQAVTDWVPRKYLKKFNVRFAGMTRPGDVVTVTGKIVEKKEEAGENIVVGNVEAKNQKNEILVAGSFAAALPSKN